MYESPLDCKEIQPVHSEGNQPWDFFGRNDAEAETPVLWPPHVKSWLIGKDCNAGRDWGQEEKGTTEDEMAGWHRWLDGSESEWTPGVGVGQGGLACCDSWGRKESDTTERLTWSDLMFMKLCSCFGICLSLKWFHLKLTFFLFSNLGLIIAQQTSIHINCFMARRWHTSCHPTSKMPIVGEGPGETPSALRCLSYLINNFLTDLIHCERRALGSSFI